MNNDVQPIFDGFQSDDTDTHSVKNLTKLDDEQAISTVNSGIISSPRHTVAIQGNSAIESSSLQSGIVQSYNSVQTSGIVNSITASGVVGANDLLLSPRPSALVVFNASGLFASYNSQISANIKEKSSTLFLPASRGRDKRILTPAAAGVNKKKGKTSKGKHSDTNGDRIKFSREKESDESDTNSAESESEEKSKKEAERKRAALRRKRKHVVKKSKQSWYIYRKLICLGSIIQILSLCLPRMNMTTETQDNAAQVLELNPGGAPMNTRNW